MRMDWKAFRTLTLDDPVCIVNRGAFEHTIFKRIWNGHAVTDVIVLTQDSEGDQRASAGRLLPQPDCCGLIGVHRALDLPHVAGWRETCNGRMISMRGSCVKDLVTRKESTCALMVLLFLSVINNNE